ncbi:hypothetical protein EDB89DRAFT_2247086 [Lactarius sanguifluus]|nr:hypothetical protein EDB89DRAFT_2247086 [Lactarius sanguifluus]
MSDASHSCIMILFITLASITVTRCDALSSHEIVAFLSGLRGVRRFGADNSVALWDLITPPGFTNGTVSQLFSSTENIGPIQSLVIRRALYNIEQTYQIDISQRRKRTMVEIPQPGLDPDLISLTPAMPRPYSHGMRKPSRALSVENSSVLEVDPSRRERETHPGWCRTTCAANEEALLVIYDNKEFVRLRRDVGDSAAGRAAQTMKFTKNAARSRLSYPREARRDLGSWPVVSRMSVTQGLAKPDAIFAAREDEAGATLTKLGEQATQGRCIHPLGNFLVVTFGWMSTIDDFAAAGAVEDVGVTGGGYATCGHQRRHQHQHRKMRRTRVIARNPRPRVHSIIQSSRFMDVHVTQKEDRTCRNEIVSIAFKVGMVEIPGFKTQEQPIIKAKRARKKTKQAEINSEGKPGIRNLCLTAHREITMVYSKWGENFESNELFARLARSAHVISFFVKLLNKGIGEFIRMASHRIRVEYDNGPGASTAVGGNSG